MENISREESKNKIKKVAKSFYKILHVMKIIMIIMIALSLISAIVLFALGITGAIDDIYEKFPKLGKVEFDSKNDRLMFIEYSKSCTLKDIYEKGDLDKLMYGIAFEQFTYSFALIIGVLICHFVQKIFRLLHQSESPFDKTLIKPFKILFIILTILVMLKAFILGLIIGGILLCLYLIYVYGCKMQEDEDMTL